MYALYKWAIFLTSSMDEALVTRNLRLVKVAH
jgi:hypothetical protein